MPNLQYVNYVEAILLYLDGQNEMGANKAIAETDKNEKICLVGFADVGAVFRKNAPIFVASANAQNFFPSF